MIYRIVTEDKNRAWIVKRVLETVSGFNITQGQGYWQGVHEPCLIIEIDTLADDNRMGIHKLALDIKYQNKQESVLFQIIGEKSILV